MMRSVVRLTFAFVIALIAASSGASALADMASVCGNWRYTELCGKLGDGVKKAA